MKYYIALLAVLFVCLPRASASRAIKPYLEKGVSGNFHYAVYNNRWLMNSKKDKLLAITGLSATAKGDIVIPDSLDGITVHGIDDRAFASSSGVTSITIPKTVRFLKAGTLNHCKGLLNIVVAKDHPDFASDNGLMFNKPKTKLLSVPTGRSGHFTVPNNTTVIGDQAFIRCAAIQKITIPQSVTDIGGFRGTVFTGCTALESIAIPNTVTNIGQKSFQDCTSLRQITLPPKVTAIPFGVFWRCTNLTTITMPDGITQIGNYAFADCRQLTLEALPAKLTKIGSYAFSQCKKLKVTTLPAGTTTVERGAFNGCPVDLAK